MDWSTGFGSDSTTGNSVDANSGKRCFVSNADENEDFLIECATVGGALLAAQRVEFLLYGLVAHIKPELKQTERQFRDLTPESFLRGDVSELRATPGQLARAYGCRFQRSTDELDAFVKSRDLIAHDYWRLSEARIRDGAELENPIDSLRGFIEDCQRWEEILRGLMAHMKLAVAQKIVKSKKLCLRQRSFRTWIGFSSTWAPISCTARGNSPPNGETCYPRNWELRSQSRHGCP